MRRKSMPISALVPEFGRLSAGLRRLVAVCQRPSTSSLTTSNARSRQLLPQCRPLIMLRSTVSSSRRWSSGLLRCPPTKDAHRSLSSSTRRADNTSSVDKKGKQRATDTQTEAATDVSLPFLQRPLGVRDRPSPRVKTWADTKEKFLDQDKRLEERTHL